MISANCSGRAFAPATTRRSSLLIASPRRCGALHICNASSILNDESIKNQQTSISLMIKRSALAAAAALAVSVTSSAAHALCPDLNTSSSGLKWCDVVEGSGETPVKGAFVKVHYVGRLDSETASGVFDSSYDRGRPLSFSLGVNQVIKGWDIGIGGDDGVPAMRPGGKRQLVIPPELGYGSRAVGGGLIPANSTLYFDVEYLGRLGGK